MNFNSINAIVALIVGVGVSVLILIFVGSLGGQTYNLVENDLENISVNYVTGESFTPINASAVALANTYVTSGTLRLENDSANVSLNNFTIDYTAGTVLLKTVAYNNTAFSAYYTYGNPAVRNSVKTSIVSSFGALEDTGSYLPIVVLAVIIAVVLALVLGMTAVTSNKGGGATL